MKAINMILEIIPKRTIIKLEKKTYKTFSEDVIPLDISEKIDGRDTFKQIMEYLSNMQYEELISGRTLEYLKTVNRLRKLNLTVYRTVARTNVDVAITKLINQGKGKYTQIPEGQRESAWYKHWYGSNEYLKFQNKYFDAILNGYAKRNMGFEGEATMVKDDKLQYIFPCDQIYICEELKMIFLVDMVPVYGNKAIDDIVYGDFKNSPLFDYNIKHYSKDGSMYYKIGLDEKARSVGYSEMNQNALLSYIENKSNMEKLESWWYTCGRKYSNDIINLRQLILDIEDKDLSKILKSYVIYPVEYMYMPFVDITSEATHKFFWSQAGSECIYKFDNRYKSTTEELKERINSADYITDYLEIDKSKTYDYYSELVTEEVSDARWT